MTWTGPNFSEFTTANDSSLNFFPNVCPGDFSHHWNLENETNFYKTYLTQIGSEISRVKTTNLTEYSQELAKQDYPNRVSSSIFTKISCGISAFFFLIAGAA